MLKRKRKNLIIGLMVLLVLIILFVFYNQRRLHMLQNTDENIIENFEANFDKFLDIVIYDVNNPDDLFIHKTQLGFEIWGGESVREQMLYIFDELGYVTIYAADDYIYFVKQGGVDELGILYVKNDLNERDYFSRLIRIRDNWYLYESFVE